MPDLDPTADRTQFVPHVFPNLPPTEDYVEYRYPFPGELTRFQNRQLADTKTERPDIYGSPAGPACRTTACTDTKTERPDIYGSMMATFRSAALATDELEYPEQAHCPLGRGSASVPN